jgi:hypothetical protein
MSVFEKYRAKAYPFNHRVTIRVARLAGGTPTDPKVAEGWLKTKLTTNRDDLIREQVAEVMVERGVTADEATKLVDTNKHLNGFKRNASGLYIEGRQMKACIKEAANVRWPKDRWGPSRKGTLSFFAEHVFVQEDIMSLGVDEPSGVAQRFVHTWRGSGIQYEEYVDDAELTFTVACDFDFTDEQWGLLWLTAEQQGIGASRSQGYGRFEVTAWDKIK